MTTPPRTPSAEFAVGGVRSFGKYLLVKKLAEGGMAEIFLAKQLGAEGFERNVVIKRMLKHLSTMPDFVEMFLDEARLAARLAHQNIVQINDLGLADECYYICMEYLAGEDLSTVLRQAGRRREYVPLNVVLRVIIEAAQGLHFAHLFADETGKPLRIVHRDISPSNLFVTYQGQVKVLDFGIAKAETRVTATTGGVVKGKYMYMSPEQARGESVDRRSDVFALGTTLYEALTNTRPFARDTDLGVLSALMNLSFKAPRQVRPDIPPELEAVVLKAMAGSVEDRYQSAFQLAAALEQFAAASTSASGGAQVAAYMRSAFGDQHVLAKTRIPSLSSLAAAGVDVPGLPNPNSPRTDVVRPPVPSPPSFDVDVSDGNNKKRAPGRSAAVFAALAAALVVGGGAFAAYWLTRERPQPSKPEVTAVVAHPVVQTPAPAAVDAGIAIAEQPGTVVDPSTLKPPPPPPPPKKAKALSSIHIQRVLSRHRGAIMTCFETHKAELPSEEGQVMVNFTILRSGKVSQANVEGALQGSRTGKCVTAQMRKIKFPVHNENDISLALPLSYRVQR